MVAYISYLFSISVPSESIRLQIAGNNDRLTESAPQKPKALIGARNISNGPALSVKFRYRRNIRRHCILKKPCLCRESDKSARRICTIRSLWAHVATYARSGDILLPRLSGKSASQQVKKVATAMSCARGREFALHACRQWGHAENTDLRRHT